MLANLWARTTLALRVYELLPWKNPATKFSVRLITLKFFRVLVGGANPTQLDESNWKNPVIKF